MKYFFHVRPWFLDFFLLLEEKMLARDPGSSIHFLTMNKSCFNALEELKKDVTYLPDAFQAYDTIDETVFSRMDAEVCEKFGFGLNYIYETERFKPAGNTDRLFIYAQARWYYDHVPAGATVVAMSCDHFCYILSGVINELKNGRNFFVQPIGFPLGGNVILSNPWKLVQVREEGLSDTFIDDYIRSLNQPPEKSIHYMKVGGKRSIADAVSNRIDLYKNYPGKKSMFSYLEIGPNLNLIPDRFRKKQLPAFVNLLDMEQLKQMAGAGRRLFYYPLQLEPEMSILAYSPFYKSQMEVIRLITQSLKASDVLVIKENPKMIGDREESFYAELKKYSNVQVIDPAVNSREIIKLAYKTISVTGTASIEAVFLGKNSLLFGYAPLRDFLLDPVVSDIPLSNFAKLLYTHHTGTEIIEHGRKTWREFSKYLVLGDFIPREAKGNKYQLKDENVLTDLLVSLAYEPSV